ncbi:MULTISPECIES: monovalent cation:proton antiporter-2 (CPA2) family protein [unclassified Roseitalea]|uniref:monovalent cation:proton antiporter-2 (CPA2) family protein n=1 Tax=unclassified Roseitalea TaxID=2639107 RepID=UPI00273F7A2E|nr:MULTISPECIES: monovalent cation:proton antiporter-2 (CPA2) family protein [unclassified Roseitalea]
MAGATTAGFYNEAILLLGGAVVAAPLFKRLGLGTVLGYLSAGIVIGPVLGLFADAEAIFQVAEFGVVLLLFVIGLELKPQRLWSMRKAIFGLGLSQVAITGLVLCALGVALGGLDFSAAIVIGFGLALSSTAFALQILEERGEMSRPHGQTSFAILLFQDLAIVPLLALVPLFAPAGLDADDMSLLDFALAIGAVAALIAAGRYLLNPLFRIIGNTGAREAMIATALFVVLASAMLMQVVGLSMAMGAFIAGVMLAESSYRHELEADIEPFRGLLLGLFFMAIGMSLDLGVLARDWLAIVLAVPVLMVVKAAIIYALVRLFGGAHAVAVRTALVLPQGGEFAFVMFSAATALGIFDARTASMLIAIVTVSMALTPVTVALCPYLIPDEGPEEMEEDFDGAEGADVLMIGFSRFGQIASQILLSGGSDVTIIDHSADRVRSAQRFGFRIYFGDGTRKEVLEAAGIRHAKIVAVTTHKKEITDRIVDLIQRDYPEVRLFVRAYDRAHTLELRARNVEYELRETFESGLVFGARTLHGLGVPEDIAVRIRDEVRKRDEERLRIQAVDGIYAGGDMLHTKPVTPEPLTKPQREARIINTGETASDPQARPQEAE